MASRAAAGGVCLPAEEKEKREQEREDEKERERKKKKERRKPKLTTVPSSSSAAAAATSTGNPNPPNQPPAAEMADAMEVERPSGAPPAADPKGKAKAAAPAAPLPPGTKRFEVKKWNAVAMWSWAICTDTCAICRNNLYEPSIEYQANPSGDADHPG